MPGYPIPESDHLHSDVDKVYIQKGSGAYYENPITIGSGDFNYPSAPSGTQPFYLIPRDSTIEILTSSDVEGTGIPAYPSHEAWFLYLKTDTPIKAGKTDYKIKIKDKKGLYSEDVILSTPGNTIAPINVSLDTTTGTTSCTDLSTQNTSATAYLIAGKKNKDNVKLTMSTDTTTASLSCEVKKVSSGETVFSINGTGSINVNLPVRTDLYEVTYKTVITATAEGFPQTTKEIYYKVHGNTVTVTTWKDLKAAVNNPLIETIKVNTEIKATSGDDAGEITVNRSSNPALTITSDIGGIINADKKNRLFSVYDNNTLTLDKLTLKNGKSNAGNAGAVSIRGNLTINNVTITDCESPDNYGGGIFISNGNFTMKGESSIKNCNASKGGAVYISNGTFNMQDAAMITPSIGTDANIEGKNDVYLGNGKTIKIDAPLSQSGIVARITPQTYTTTTQILTGTELPNVYTKFTVTDQSTQSWTIKEDGKLERTYPITFNPGTQGTLTAIVNGKTITSGDKVVKDALVTFTAKPNSNYVVNNWTLTPSGTFEAGGQPAVKTAILKVSQAANVAVSFRLRNNSDKFIYLTGIIGDKGYYWENGSRFELPSLLTGSVKIRPQSITLKDNTVYAAGFEFQSGVTGARVWKNTNLPWCHDPKELRDYAEISGILAGDDNTLYISGSLPSSTAPDAFIGKITTEALDPNPKVFLHNSQGNAQSIVTACCADASRFYAVGNVREGTTYKWMLWTINKNLDPSSLTEYYMIDQNINSANDICVDNNVVYIVAKDTSYNNFVLTVTNPAAQNPIITKTPLSTTASTICKVGNTFFIGGNGGIWKFDGTSISTQIKMRNLFHCVFAIAAHGDEIVAAGYVEEGYKPAYWKFTPSVSGPGDVTETILDTTGTTGYGQIYGIYLDY